ncbi:hypothetical protein, partial [Haliangium sp.]|uniref:hypothetical protein n=1 Tax=Haliangium sp. TaxID=2663208 RepID=UPI003D0D5888
MTGPSAAANHDATFRDRVRQLGGRPPLESSVEDRLAELLRARPASSVARPSWTSSKPCSPVAATPASAHGGER